MNESDPQFWETPEVTHRLKTFSLDANLFSQISALPAKAKRVAIDYVSKMEWHKCAGDILYWLTPSLHFSSEEYPEGTPYVFTQERKALYECVSCSDGQLYNADKQPLHLKFRHGLEYDRFKDVAAMFKELDRRRVFNLLPYMPVILETFASQPVTLVKKSRDMMATWLAVTYFAHDTLFHRNKQNCFQSLTATKTLEAVERVYFIWKNQPAFLRKQHMATFSAGTTRSGNMRIESLGSEIIGLPRGADQIRQYHPSGIFSDEAAFQAEAGAMFQAIRPSIMNGGKYIAVSSAAPGWFEMAAEDTLDQN
jgi:hypothetical protein